MTARVYVRSPSTWYSTVQINKGSSDGVRVNQPVVNGAGLVGKVKSVSDGNAVVMLLTDQQFGVSAQAVKAREPGAILPAVGAPGDLLLDLVPRAKRVKAGDRIITAGTVSERLPSPFPRGLLIGTVKRDRGRRRARPHDPRGAGRRPAPAGHRPGPHEARRAELTASARDARRATP